MNDSRSFGRTEFGLSTHSPSITGSRLIRPRALPRGGRIAVLAASSPSTSDRIERAAENLRSLGYDVVFSSNLFERHEQYLAGEDSVRLDELNRLLRDPSIDAFFFARGGYGAMRILDQIDYDAMRANPRPLVGYSDVTALHQALATRAGIVSFHGPMLNTDFHDGLSPEIDRWFWNVLAGGSPTFHFEQAGVLSQGVAEGVLFGGCLSLTTALTATPYDHWVDDGIWFWEDVTEPTYRIDRMLTHLRLSGRLQGLRGIMIGRLKECGGSDPAGLDTLLNERFAAAGIPVLRDLPFGHFGDNLLLPIGTNVRLDATNRTLKLLEPAVDLARG